MANPNPTKRVKVVTQAATPQEVEKEERKKAAEEAAKTAIDNAIDWFNRLSGDDNLKHAAVTTCSLIRDNVGIVYQDDMWPLIPMIYDAVYESLIDLLASKRIYHKKYKITVGKNFSMGYDNIDTRDAEQEGCFMPMMEHTGNTIRFQGHTNMSKKVTYTLIDNMYAENYTGTSDIEHIKANAMQRLQKMYSTDKDGNVLEADKCSLFLPTNLIMIIFSLYHDALLMRLKMMKEADPDEDVELNVLGLYVMSIEEVDPKDANMDGWYISYAPKDIVKLSLKDNALEARPQQ